MDTTTMKRVKYLGSQPTIRKGQTALMNHEGKVQFDFGYLGWAGKERNDPRCYGWHDCGLDWVELDGS